MSPIRTSVRSFGILLGIGCVSLIYNHAALAHCDTVNGPIIPEARVALENGDSTPVLKWVKPEFEQEVQAAFAQAQQVRRAGAEAQQLADTYFLETLIRVHRAGEGAPYTGISDTMPEEIIALADQSLIAGSADAVIAKIQTTLAARSREKFNTVLEAAKNKDASVEAGREYVEAYIQYTHYVEHVFAAIEQSEEATHGEETCNE